MEKSFPTKTGSSHLTQVQLSLPSRIRPELTQDQQMLGVMDATKTLCWSLSDTPIIAIIEGGVKDNGQVVNH
jgi:hypothetical protein